MATWQPLTGFFWKSLLFFNMMESEKKQGLSHSGPNSDKRSGIERVPSAGSGLICGLWHPLDEEIVMGFVVLFLMCL